MIRFATLIDDNPRAVVSKITTRPGEEIGPETICTCSGPNAHENATLIATLLEQHQAQGGTIPCSS